MVGIISLYDPLHFQNHHHQIDYTDVIQRNRPIGSEITEAGCKVIIKARLFAVRMKWQQFWVNINQYSFNIVEP
jgi:hypothetical protein